MNENYRGGSSAAENEDDAEHSSSRGEDESPFFADMTLDLAEAHDIAETPEPRRKVLTGSVGASSANGKSLEMPNFSTPASTRSNLASLPEEGHGEQNTGRGVYNTPTMHRISSDQVGAAGAHRLTPSARRYPRDVSWAAAFCTLVPLCLLIPIFLSPSLSSTSDNVWIAAARAPRLATIHTLLWGFAASLILCRLLYRTMGGGDGEDARHFASQVLLASGPVSAGVYVLLAIGIYWMTPKAWYMAAIPLWYLARDIYLFGRWKRAATTPGGRQAFFQALSCMTLDILSRSLRRLSFFRIVTSLVTLQLGVICIWRMALLGAIRSKSFVYIVMAILGGKWATGFVARLLSLIASGGIVSWFAQQSELIQQQANGDPSQEPLESEDVETETIEFHDEADGGFAASIPAAYRATEGSAYKPALILDEGMDDDFDDEEGSEEESNVPAEFRTTSNDTSQYLHNSIKSSTVKTLLFSGLSISFGSVAQCGLLGGLAQFVWSQLRKIDHARQTFGGFQGMNIGVQEDQSLWSRILQRANIMARSFVRSHSDMAMSHVAAYKKNYRRAAQDVAQLVDESGVEAIIHDDVSTHMSACVGGSISGTIVLFTGFILVHQRNRSSAEESDVAVVIDMILAFIFCYTLIFTVMEPLRASIKAVYVSFAEHPQSLSQTYPLIYHRLNRMSESNIS